MSSDVIQKLKEYFGRFPGIGPRQAQRFVYWLLNEDSDFIKNLSNCLIELKKNTKQCEKCFRFFTSVECSICKNLGRDNSQIIVVEKDVDFENIEKSGFYNGLYFILGGVISLDQTKIENIKMKELFNRASKGSKDKKLEIILALSATAEGDNTARYIEKILEPIIKKQNLKISRFGRGLSTGTELEYIDRETLKNALETRK